ncbi:MAG: transcriptional repressor [Clostridiaceae bacterium]|nr:transcriptional repressor [Clostridiaceae bacterium]
MVKQISDLKEHLKNNSYKLTGQRLAVLRLLAENSSRHLNAEEIHRLLSEKESGVGIATVYRTLSLLEKLKFITRIHLDDGCIRYQISDPEEKHDHHHLICECCGDVIDIQEDLLDSLEKQVLKENGFKVSNHSVKLYGICKKCSHKQKE